MDESIHSRDILSEEDLRRIAAESATLWERFHEGLIPLETDLPFVEEKIARWRETIAPGHEEAFQKYLAWNGFSDNRLRPLMGSVAFPPSTSLPDWAVLLKAIVSSAASAPPAFTAHRSIRPDSPLPFEDLLIPVVDFAGSRLKATLNKLCAEKSATLADILSEKAFHALERDLLRRLCSLCGKTLLEEFSKTRPVGVNLTNLLFGSGDDESPDDHYRAFVAFHLKDGMAKLFKTYPVLARILPETVTNWMTASTLLIRDYLTHAGRLPPDGQATADGDKKLLRIAGLELSLSDAHHHGRSVAFVTLETGVKVVYKPRDMKIEKAFGDLLGWLNAECPDFHFQIPAILPGDGCGWMEYVHRLPAQTPEDIRRYYDECGRLLCLLYLLGATDCHAENLVAAGAHPVLVDLESLLQPPERPTEGLSFTEELDTRAGRLYWDSVLRTGMLPHWEIVGGKRRVLDQSGMGQGETVSSMRQVYRWTGVNRDDMDYRLVEEPCKPRTNLPQLGGIPMPPYDFSNDICAGFRRTYQFLENRRRELTREEGPLGAFQSGRVRHLFRHTEGYARLLAKTSQPEYLKDGIGYGTAFDVLGRTFLVGREKPAAFAALHAERQALTRRDIPYFFTDTSESCLAWHSGRKVEEYFLKSGFEAVLERLGRFGKQDMERQLDFIASALQTGSAKEIETAADDGKERKNLCPDRGVLLEEAQNLAAAILQSAIQEADGALNWIALRYFTGAERLQPEVLGDDLYNGKTGIALFFATLYRATGDPVYVQTVRRALQSLQTRMERYEIYALRQMVRSWGLGAAAGAGGLMYALTRIGSLLDDPALLRQAERIAGILNRQPPENESEDDVLNGAAGAILGALALYRETRFPEALDLAVKLGDRLLSRRVVTKSQARAWLSIRDVPLAGFAHGTAGIACALYRLYETAGDRRYLEAAQEGLVYEDSLFSETEGNWRDMRNASPPSFSNTWCNGAPGIYLSRLDFAPLSPAAESVRKMERALQTVGNPPLQANDHLCCGNSGRIETLFEAAGHHHDPMLADEAQKLLGAMIERAATRNGYRLHAPRMGEHLNPGFFQGLAGIGYTMLRGVTPDLPCVLRWR